MARNLHVYPKVLLDGSTWTLILKVYEPATGVTSRIEDSTAAGVTTASPVRLLKISFDLTVGDSDTDQDVFDALTVDDIKPGPQTATVASNWIDRAETAIGTLSAAWGQADFNAAQKKPDTSKMRGDANKALVDQRGWVIVAGSVHQHEGDGTNTDA